MKQCPTCKRTYNDDSLRFCLEDGASLIRPDGSSGSTMTMPAKPNADKVPRTVPYVAKLPHSPTVRSRKRGIVVGAILLGVGIALVSALSWFKPPNAGSQAKENQTAGGARVPTEFRLGESFPSAELIPMTVRGSDEKVYLHSQPLLTSYHIASAQAITSQYGPQIDLQLTDAGREILARLTENNVNKRLGILVGQELLSAPTILHPVSSGRVTISGNFSAAEAKRLAEDIAGK